jgi:hypothetical protein
MIRSLHTAGFHLAAPAALVVSVRVLLVGVVNYAPRIG